MKRWKWIAGWLVMAPMSVVAQEKWQAQAERMVKEQIEARGVQDRRVLTAMRTTPRHLFIPEQWRLHAYEDYPVPIGYGQTISQPYIVAVMTELLELKGKERVLEIGTGSGYQAAILSQLVDSVFTIEIIPELCHSAHQRLHRLGYNNVVVKCADGYKGWKEKAPFDRIIVTAAPPEIPEELVRQLRVGGVMVLPVGKGYQKLIRVMKTSDTSYTVEEFFPVRFVPMIKGQ